MQESKEAADTLVRFYDRRSAADASAYDDIVSADQLVMVGTAPGEWFEDREQLRKHFSTPGLRIEAGGPRGFAEGRTAWAIDTPTLALPDGTRIETRLTAVLHEEDGAWKLVHLHFSVAVPDDAVAELQERGS